MRSSGTVKWFDRTSGFGFIISRERDCFVHRSAIDAQNVDSLAQGEAVEFAAVYGPTGPAAENVVRTGGAELKGDHVTSDHSQPELPRTEPSAAPLGDRIRSWVAAAEQGLASSGQRLPLVRTQLAALHAVYRIFGTVHRKYQQRTGRRASPGLDAATVAFEGAPSLDSLTVVAEFLDELVLLPRRVFGVDHRTYSPQYSEKHDADQRWRQALPPPWTDDQ